MTVMDFYKVARISEKIMIRKIVKENYDSYFKLLYDGTVDGLPVDLFEMNVLDIRFSWETFSIMVTVEYRR